jgi:hypothetical protein
MQKELYRKFCSKNKVSRRTSGISQTIFTQICKDFNNEVIRSILREGLEFYIPEQLGTIRVIRANRIDFSNPKQRKAVDWEATEKHGKVIFYEDPHTNGYWYQFRWKKASFHKIRNKEFFKFIPSSLNKRQLAKILKDPNRTIDYFNGI